MSGHTGFFHDPTSDINAIREMLNDRYHLGLPVIKELIQNADDAQAKELIIGWARGVVEARNPLLKGPGVFVINDGPFSEEDARAIKFMGQSAKVEGATIGKFGLGLKSVFHHCEAFFYLSSEYREIKRGNRIYRTRDILNPWCGEEGSPFPEWDDFTAEDQNRLIHILRPLLPSKQWFCLWLPLRRRELFRDSFDPLFRRFEGSDHKEAPPASIFLPKLDRHIGTMIPTLRHLDSIRAVQQNGDGTFDNCVKVTLQDKAARMAYEGKPFDMRELHGHVNLSADIASSMVFGGCENFLQNPSLLGLKDSENWPRRSVTENGKSISKPEKADPHCAIVFTGHPNDTGRSKLDISWGIFLPVGDTYETLQDGGDWDFTLLLHGIFFVDAGRFRIEFDNLTPEVNDPNRTIRRQWNQLLRDNGTLRLLLPGLKSFVQKNRLNGARTGHLTRLLKRSQLFKEFRDKICQDHAWVWRIGNTNEWTLISIADPIYVLPSPPRDERNRPFEVFGNLRTLSNQLIFTYQGLPCLDQSKIWAWPTNVLQKILDIQVVSVFNKQAHLDYVVQFLEGLPESDRMGIAGRLQEIAHNALSTVDRRDLRKHCSVVQRFMVFVPPDRRLTLTGENFNTFDGLFKSLLKLDLNLLLVPESLTPENIASTGKLSLNEGRCILETLAAYQSDDEEFDELRINAMKISVSS